MNQQWIHYKPYLKHLARTLRNNMTLSEILLWKHLKGKQLLGYDFHRQRPIGKYIVDFYCPVLKLVIEIDGDSHGGKEEADRVRQQELEAMGVTVLRFWDNEVKQNAAGVIDTVREWIEARATHP
jgi:very-short-patch-repair endonuclease